MHLPPDKLIGGVRYLVDAHNRLRDFAIKTRVIPGPGWTETSEGLLPPGSGSTGNSFGCCGLGDYYYSPELNTSFKKDTGTPTTYSEVDESAYSGMSIVEGSDGVFTATSGSYAWEGDARGIDGVTFTETAGSPPVSSFTLIGFPPTLSADIAGTTEVMNLVVPSGADSQIYQGSTYNLTWDAQAGVSGTWYLNTDYERAGSVDDFIGEYADGGNKASVFLPGTAGGIDDAIPIMDGDGQPLGHASLTFDGASATLAVGVDGSATGSVTINSSTGGGGVTITANSGAASFGGTAGVVVPTGTTAQRQAVEGMVRANSTTGNFEGYRSGSWRNLEGGGDFSGPASSTDNAIVRFDGTGGKTGQNSGATIDDSGNLSANNFSGSSSGTNTGDQTITLTGDVTGSGSGSFAATIADEAVTYAKMQHVSATDKLLGRSTAGAGDVEEIACTAAGRALLDDADAAAQRATMGADNASNLTTGTIPAARVGADHLDAITEIATALKTGSDAKLVTGTAGTAGNVPEWDANGDIVDSGLGAAGIQRLQTSARTATTSVIPTDSTIPQSTEGTLIFTMTHTVASNTTLLEVDVVLHLSASGAISVVYALFEPSASANALAASYWTCPGANYGITVPLRYYIFTPTSGSRSFTLRVGTNTASTTAVVNGGFSASQYLGGVETSSMTIREYSKSP